MSKKSLSILCLILAMTMLFAACTPAPAASPTPPAKVITGADADGAITPPADDSDADADAPPAGEAQKLVFWYPHGGEPDKGCLENTAKRFGTEHPEYDVQYEFIGGSGAGVGMTDKLMTAISGGNPPDLVLFDRFMVGQWADQGLFTDITDQAAANGMTPDKYYEFAWAEASLKGRLYAFPFDTDNRLLYYNKDKLAAAGIQNPPKTIAELDAAADKLTVKKGNRFEQLGFVPWINQGSIYLWGWAFGGKMQDASGKITVDDPQVVKAMEWMVTYAEKYGIEDITNFTTTAGGGMDPFAAKMIAMVVTGPWAVSSWKKQAPDLNYDVTYVPTPTGDNFNSWAGGWSMIIPNGAKNVEGAFKLGQDFSMGDGAVAYGEETTHFMCFKEINNKLTWVKGNPIFDKFVEMFPKSFCRPPIAKGQLLWDEMLSAQNRAINKAAAPKDLLEAVAKKVNAELGIS